MKGTKATEVTKRTRSSWGYGDALCASGLPLSAPRRFFSSLQSFRSLPLPASRISIDSARLSPAIILCMLPLTEARDIIAKVVKPLESVMLPLPQLVGRVLREAIAAREDFPSFDRSAMDGYAVAIADDSPRFKVIGEIQPGSVPAFSIGRGECARIFTGAHVPQGASQVIMQEDTTREGEWMIPQSRSSDTFVRQRGEDTRAGTVLLEAGARIGPGEAALLAQLGVVEARVSPSPRVIHFATGNELVSPEVQPDPGQIRDSNSTLIAALLEAQGARLMAQERCGDDLEGLIQAIRNQPNERWDMLLISGGASVGDYDFGRRALTELGFEIHFQQINLRPGKPLVFASRGSQVAFVIPGNPVSHFVTFHVAIRAALERLDALDPGLPLIEATLDNPLRARPGGRETWWPAHLRFANGRPHARLLKWQSSGDLCGLVGANALVRTSSGDSSAAAEGSCDCVLVGDL